MKFNYQGRTKEGEIRSGNVEASSEEAALNLLQKHGLYVTFLEESVPPFYARRIKIFEKVSNKDLVLFSRQLAIMFKSKIPLVESLKALSEQTGNADLKDKIMEISSEVEGGTLLSNALSKFPQVFSSFYVAMVRAGEVSGKLSDTLDYLAGHLEREYYLNSKTKSALIYPSLILVVVMAVLAIMNFFVIPQMAQILVGGGEPLPMMTQIVLKSSEIMRKWWWLPTLLLVGLIIFCFRFYLTEKGRRFFDEMFIKMPLIGPFIKTTSLARLAENLSTLIAGGLPISQALEVVAGIMDNVCYKDIMFEIRERVGAGEPISSVLLENPTFFEPVFIQMVLVGERTGTLETTLMNVVGFYQKEIDNRINSILSVLEPALIVFLGAVVGGIMLSVMMPLYKMMSI
jgi:type IV pilus assembly protein PilC